jgi:hypothetical protein
MIMDVNHDVWFRLNPGALLACWLQSGLPCFHAAAIKLLLQIEIQEQAARARAPHLSCAVCMLTHRGELVSKGCASNQECEWSSRGGW